MKLVSWNVNGIRANLKKGFIEYLKEENPDIIGLQEIRAEEDYIKNELEEIKNLGYEIFWNNAQKKGYAGTAIFTKIKPVSYGFGIGDYELEEIKISGNGQFSLFGEKKENNNYEGRMICLEFPNFYFLNLYVPNAQHGLTRLDYRKKWDALFLENAKKLEKNKPLIFCGDLNVAHTEIDLANPKSNKKNAGFTIEERNGFSKYLENGFVDTFRFFYPDKTGAYSWWSNFANARARNIGWRIDYFLVSQSLKKDLKDAFIRNNIEGSDHCPVGIKIF
ncbi:MAG: exodeoxyribonuclease III [Candidatus Gracilibacteria bacterium]|nr:exodeoxyribonuclease III [Candidatus Gracilibacteria bacterium]MDD3119910.1 exodeoxyribonuclease III [Candidatus Gracilibacteria bacterium]MDD4530032.1 exodeoxyribonuclease III [Candidatus Gracilibacteria bacterium]